MTQDFMGQVPGAADSATKLHDKIVLPHIAATWCQMQQTLAGNPSRE
jgi:hypothetical protein